MTASHMDFHPGADISVRFLLKRWSRARHGQNDAFLFARLQENKLIKRQSRGHGWSTGVLGREKIGGVAFTHS